ncbi:PepSY domain-containing protein [Sphingomonas lacunae]|uniref:PepSY domain-containing protein n=2 Tax=Sphingomonas lacunae TaxID=2698828 RepID=A0A6M4AX52_9SPHN|nr:PepSY domain-containing protein [Sphingomonas lacunae]
MGLSVGAVFCLIALSGSALVFYPEIDAMLHPEMDDPRTASLASYDRAIIVLRETYTDKHGPWRFEVTGAAGPIPARYYNPPETDGRAFAPMMVWLSADGQQIVRQDWWGDYAMTLVYDFHYRLLGEHIGAIIVGWLGIATTLLLLSGLAAWWPKGSLRKALRHRRQAPAVRRLRDMHKLTGLAALIPLALLCMTGAMLALPAESETMLTPLLGPPDPAPDSKQLTASTGPDLPPSQAAATAQRALPNARLAWIEIPGAGDCCYRIRLQQRSDPSRRFPHSFVLVSRYDAGQIMVKDAARAGPHSRVNNWLHPLHDGSFGGMATRLATVLVGLLPLLLFGSGLWRWRLRHRRATPQRPTRG